MMGVELGFPRKRKFWIVFTIFSDSKEERFKDTG
jgi:hypothetical protein